MSSRTVLVTGATGCVGSHVVEALCARGDKVRVLVRDPKADMPWAKGHAVEVIQGDLTNPEALRRAATGVDEVVHCAAKVGDWGPLEEYRQANVEGLRHLLEAAKGPQLKRFVHLSSLGTYEARHHYGTDETTPLPVTHMDGYTQSKAEADRLALEFHQKHRMPVVVLRPGFIYGPRDRTVLPKLVENLRQGKVKYLGSGRQAMNCIFVGNLVDAVLLALENPKAIGEAFNITDGEYVSKKRFIEKVADGFKVPRPGWFKVPLWIAMPVAKFMESAARKSGAKEPPLLTGARVKFLGLNLDFSIEKARKVLGYSPRVGFDEGMEKTSLPIQPPESAGPSHLVDGPQAFAKTNEWKKGSFVGSGGPGALFPLRVQGEGSMNLKGLSVAILVEQQYQEMEVWYPHYRLIEAGAKSVLVGPEAGKAYPSKLGYPAKADVSIDQVSADQFDGVVLPGGFAPDFLRRNPAMIRFTQTMADQAKVLAAICHGPWMLCSTTALRGKRATCFFAIKDDVINAGAKYEDAEVIRDGNVITSRKPDDLPAFMVAMMGALAERKS